MTFSPELPVDRQFISLQELKAMGFFLYRVGKLVENGFLVRLNRRMYRITEYVGEESDFCLVSAYIPDGVVCLLSAASYHNLTTYIPDSINVAIPRKARVSTKPEWPRVTVSYFTEDRYTLGISEVTEGKNRFKVYDAEKTVTDIVFYREKVGIEETREILTTYLRMKNRNLNRLLEYAERLKCEEIMRQYLEVLV